MDSPGPGTSPASADLPFDIGFLPDVTSPLQSFALFILFFFSALAMIVVSLRAAGRWGWRQFGWDDTLICFAMFMSAMETAASYKFIKTNYIGIRFRDIPPRVDPTEGLIWSYAVQILYNPILALVKLSVLVFLHRLFAQKRGVKTCVVALGAVTALQMIAVLSALVFQCTPISFNWTVAAGASGTCVDRNALYVSTAAFTIVTDVLVLLIPGYIFRDLNIPRKTKIALLFVFLLGGLVTAASIARLMTLVVGLYGLVPNQDPTYNIGFVTSAIETNLALITASAPAMMPLLRSWFPSMFAGGGPTRSSAATTGAPLRSMRKERESEEGPYSTPSIPKSYN